MKPIDRFLMIVAVLSAVTLILFARPALAQHGMIDLLWWFWRQ